MIDYTHPARKGGRDSELAAALHAAEDHAGRLVQQGAHAGSDPAAELNDWYDTVQTVADACTRTFDLGNVPPPDEARALDTWLLRTTGCLGACRQLLRADRPGTEPPMTDDEVRDAYLALLDLTHLVHESADHVRRSLAARRDGIPPREASERFVRSRIGHQDLMRRALRLLSEEDARRDEWMFRHVVLAQRVAEYGGESPGEVEAARATAAELARPAAAWTTISGRCSGPPGPRSPPWPTPVGTPPAPRAPRTSPSPPGRLAGRPGRSAGRRPVRRRAVAGDHGGRSRWARVSTGSASTTLWRHWTARRPADAREDQARNCWRWSSTSWAPR
ncbi:hypothetical protein ACG93S_24745 [Streptomyces sp. WAC01490]|uniref:hypothetical protein n=1 Tax=unclassified Streptomyces TaxID=2593676 RepID=UPI003F2B05EB